MTEESLPAPSAWTQETTPAAGAYTDESLPAPGEYSDERLTITLTDGSIVTLISGEKLELEV